MRQVNDIVLPATADTSTKTVNGSTLDTNQMVDMSFHCVVSDATAAGTFKLQASNDVAPLQISGPNFVPTNWVDIPSQSVVMTAGTQQGLLTLSNVAYRWVRAVFIVTTLGTGTVQVSRLGIGV